MSDIFDIDDGSLTLPAKGKKKQKEKREISDERRAMLIANLKKGRETSAKNRAKKKTAKEILKRKKTDFIDDTIRDEVLKQEKQKKSYTDLEKELSDLKKLYEPVKNSSVKVIDDSSDYHQEKVIVKDPKQPIIKDPKQPIIKEEPIINDYAENLKNNNRQRFTAKDIIQEQETLRQSKKYGGSVKKFRY